MSQQFPPKVDGPVETPDGDPILWSNPDVPRVNDVISGDVERFDCPYVEDKVPCEGEFEILNRGETDEENRERIVKLIKQSNGTVRCEKCNEPIFGFYGNGDH